MKKIMVIVLAVIMVLVISGCSTKGKVNKVSPAEFKELIKDENVFVLDVHTPEQVHIEGTDAFIPFDKIIEKMDLLPVDTNTPIALYCKSGSMSGKSAEELAAMGYMVYDLQGGRNAYVAEFGDDK